MVLAFLEIHCLFSGTSVASVADTEAGCRRPPGWLGGQRKDLFMGEARLHVVFGTGQVGNALAAHLAGLGVAVRAPDFFGPGVTQGSVASLAAR